MTASQPASGEHELRELWDSPEWRSAWARQTRRVEVDRRILAVLIGLVLALCVVGLIGILEELTDRDFLPVVLVAVGLGSAIAGVLAVLTWRVSTLPGRERAELAKLARTFRARTESQRPD